MNKPSIADAKSPYLLQHRDNPVDWRPWGAAAFAEARERDVPVFLSVGYSTCHWCHVMARESFENPEIASVMNRYFVNIKLDREEHPDVDRLYMAFVQATTGSGGWPMSVWLTPEGEPFFGGTYFPPEDRYGRAGFVSVLEKIAEAWSRDRPRLREHASKVLQALDDASAAPAGAMGDMAACARSAIERLDASFDAVHGGFGGAPKFPQPGLLDFLLHAAVIAPGLPGNVLDQSLTTLRAMAEGGMCDQLGGGFHRYSVDAFWHVPHFEKMLYDQAQLAVVYLEAFQITGDTNLRNVVENTLDYVLARMTSPHGGFYSAEDADSAPEAGSAEHVEGAFYVWEHAEIQKLLPEEEARIFCRHFGVEPSGNVRAESDPHGELRGKNVLFRKESIEATASALNETPDAVKRALEKAADTLLAHRAKRPRPHLDDKILAAWNGLMISAFARAGGGLRRTDYLAAAQKAARFLIEHLWVESDRLLLRSWREGPSDIPGFAEDHACCVQGLLDLYEADHDTDWLRLAVLLQETMEEEFKAPGGGYFGGRANDPLVKVRMKDDHDGAEPSAQSVAAKNLVRLSRLLHRDDFSARAREVIASSSPVLDRIPHAMPVMLIAGLLEAAPPRQAILAGPRGAAWDALDTVLQTGFRPTLARLAIHPPDPAELPEDPNPALQAMTEARSNNPALYVCENFACQQPVHTPTEALAALEK